MNVLPSPRGLRSAVVVLLCFLVLACGTIAGAQELPEPAVYLNFDEGSGTYALDGSGHGNAASFHNVSRIENGGCGRAIVFSNPDSYVSVPFRTLNHPANGITVSAWFYTDLMEPAALVSSYNDGGYRLGFDDGNDLWWTLNLERAGEVSIAVQHENIAPRQWHQVTGTYDGTVMKIFLDGILRNQVNATGRIHYETDNYVFLGAEAGASDTPLLCPLPFRGGLDEIRIYPVALNFNQVMDDRFRCLEGERSPESFIPPEPATCEPVSGSVHLGMNESAVRVLSFPNSSVNGSWQVSLPPGSVLSVHAVDRYGKAAPDAWYLEITDESGRLTRTIAFPARNNAPAEAVIPSGNATVTIRYFSGIERFPARVILRLDILPPPRIRQQEPRNILENPIIVIYSASWATVVAIILVMMWLHRRKKAREAGAGKDGSPPPGTDKKL